MDSALRCTYAVAAEQGGPSHVIGLIGELDRGTAGGLTFELDRPGLTDNGWLVLDLSALTFIDAAGLRAVLDASRRVTARGGRLQVISSESVERLLQLTGFDGAPRPRDHTAGRTTNDPSRQARTMHAVVQPSPPDQPRVPA